MQQVVQTDAACNVQQCCDRLRGALGLRGRVVSREATRTATVMGDVIYQVRSRSFKIYGG